VHGPAAAFNVYKSSRSPLLDRLPLQSFPNTPSLGRLTSSCAIDPSPPRPTQNAPSQLKSLDGTAGLKPEPSILSICHSGFDACDYRDGDHSSGWHRTARDTSVIAARCRLLAVAPSQSSRQCLPRRPRQWRLALGIPFMRYDLANGRNASRRRSQLLPGCAVALRVGGRVSVSSLRPVVTATCTAMP
jgi:hypothetical protein